MIRLFQIINFIPPTLYLLIVIMLAYFIISPRINKPSKELKGSKILSRMLNISITFFSVGYLLMVLILAYDYIVTNIAISVATSGPSLMHILPFPIHLGATIYYFSTKQSSMKYISAVGTICFGVLLLFLIMI